MHISAIVVAAGRGTRMGRETAKVLLPVGGVPMAAYPLRTLAAVPGLTSIILVVAAENRQAAAAMVERSVPGPIPTHIVAGGA
ncbi:MAG TPA: NTP transferase domain-containing protein, partial [Candidatus Acidoferrales bacterium]|nr:NTP transferase domain-containing protein [Candidatus Acidoferrales bacterium]